MEIFVNKNDSSLLTAKARNPKNQDLTSSTQSIHRQYRNAMNSNNEPNLAQDMD